MLKGFVVGCGVLGIFRGKVPKISPDHSNIWHFFDDKKA
ncbi:hypothetical protein N44_04167 [Microcystis aeruginosa NIES-44]|uniref:Uncharacterized protein n=1 Tax=Microcystis aeruginosa NIES-44 TaxID=449439 RepID=A0A0A1VZR6_MICAE|nr:hypothetical protein N44_04167 [Microcystis aeruginosa NIES-44]